jgi:hypothetical protein
MGTTTVVLEQANQSASSHTQFDLEKSTMILLKLPTRWDSTIRDIRLPGRLIEDK